MVQNPQFLINIRKNINANNPQRQQPRLRKVLPQGLRAPRISYNKKCFQYTEYLFFLLQEVDTIFTF